MLPRPTRGEDAAQIHTVSAAVWPDSLFRLPGSAYVCCMYRLKGNTDPRKIVLQAVDCPGTEYWVKVGGRQRHYGSGGYDSGGYDSGNKGHWIMDRREMTMTNVEAAIQAGYESGQRLATAINVEGQIGLLS